MKAALITSRLSQAGGGVAAAVEGLSRHLHGPAADVQVIGIRDNKWRSGCAEWKGAPVTALAVRGPEGMAYMPMSHSVIRVLDPTIVHTHGLWAYPSRLVPAWAAATRRPYIVSPHGMLDPWAIRHARWKKKIAAWLYENAHLRRASCLHALCESEAAAIRKLGFVNPICVIPNGIARPNAPNDLPPPWREVVPKNASVMLFLGRLHPKKNVEALLDAWPRTIEYDNWHLVIAGWGQAGHQQRLTDKIERRGLGKRVHFIGSLFGDKKHAALRHAHAFVLPSLSEGLPMAVLEAWSYGLPVLMTDACNLPEGFRTHAAVHLSLEPCRMQSDLMNFLKLDCARLEQIGRNGRRLVETQFDWGTVAEQMLAVYTWLVHGGSPPPAVQMV